jgi:hypothetical protein
MAHEGSIQYAESTRMIAAIAVRMFTCSCHGANADTALSSQMTNAATTPSNMIVGSGTLRLAVISSQICWFNCAARRRYQSSIGNSTGNAAPRYIIACKRCATIADTGFHRHASTGNGGLRVRLGPVLDKPILLKKLLFVRRPTAALGHNRGFAV